MKLKNTKLREGDEVIVITGREKGKRGNIKSIMGEKCIINDLNLAKKHTRPNPQLGITGGIVATIPPVIPSCGLGLVCFFAKLRSLIMHFSPIMLLMLPLLPFSLPVITITSSPSLSFVFFNFITVPPVQVRQSS